MLAPMMIEKETIDTLTFCEAKLGTKEVESITKKLFDAMMLGNMDHYKVKISFNTLDGVKEVFTTIWATTDRFIVLKGGRYIPINSIIEVG
ncbi:MAG: hypothetical protein KA242_03315 [Chitinophagales bacterium]|jgi:hypothetical protein|nr:hypothetical protein [Chitinophagales bacterium]